MQPNDQLQTHGPKHYWVLKVIWVMQSHLTKNTIKMQRDVYPTPCMVCILGVSSLWTEEAQHIKYPQYDLQNAFQTVHISLSLLPTNYNAPIANAFRNISLTTTHYS